jgi:hypothetical protein
MVRLIVLWVIPLVAAAWVLRTALVLGLRARWPAAARWVDRWWLWAPLVFVLVAVTVVQPLLGVAGAVVLWFALTSARAAGSPFRPRR